jgi:hypothetical protein
VEAKPVVTDTALKGHELGDEPAVLWVNGLVFIPKTLKPSAESFHPNPLGHRAMARAFLTSVPAEIPEWLKN